MNHQDSGCDFLYSQNPLSIEVLVIFHSFLNLSSNPLLEWRPTSWRMAYPELNKYTNILKSYQEYVIRGIGIPKLSIMVRRSLRTEAIGLLPLRSAARLVAAGPRIENTGMRF